MTYFVTMTGDDANDGSKAHPWRRISRALPHLTLNDTLHISVNEHGLYFEPEDDTLVHDGTSIPVVLEDVGVTVAQVVEPHVMKQWENK